MEDIFTPDNTEWVDDDHGGWCLSYTGDMGELAKEAGKTEDELCDILSDYEETSKDLINTIREIEMCRKGQY